MRYLPSQFHFRHALFALQGPDGYVDALMATAREEGLARCARSARRPLSRPGAERSETRQPARA